MTIVSVCPRPQSRELHEVGAPRSACLISSIGCLTPSPRLHTGTFRFERHRVLAHVLPQEAVAQAIVSQCPAITIAGATSARGRRT